MKRSLPDVLRRGLDSTIANWPVIALRIAESVVLIGIVIASIIVALIPAIVAAGLSKDEIMNSSDPPAAIVGWLIGHLMLFVWMLALAFIVLGVLLAIHAFVEGGIAQIYVDGERNEKRHLAAGRDAFRAFSVDRWLAGGAASWWRIFWLYNWAWSVGLLFVLVPLMLTIVGLVLVSDTVGRMVVGCVGLAIAILVLIPVAIVISVWCAKAITICVARSLPARESLRVAWRAVRGDLGRHVAVAVIAFVVSMALNSIVSAVSVPMTITQHQVPSMELFFTPVRLVSGVFQSMVSAAVGSWLMACFVSMTEER
ncbi:MAG: hypothetical protein JO093_09505 [Acidobacteria bacterium]|nr:hypothetical protein [Acidobacteriota bacterium]MBV9068620.1 hypothetical protein [Acidobacteriota bacterium]MBV9185850.1 hypothetical protein [Acidobacteriota bacterium]